MTQNIDQCVLKNPGVGRNIDLSDNSSKTREILSPNEILKHRNVYSLPETNILSLKWLQSLRGPTHRILLQQSQTKHQGKYVTLGQNMVSLMENSCWF